MCKKFLTRFAGFLMTLKGVVSLLVNPSSTSSIYDIEDGLRYVKPTNLSVEFIKLQPEVAQVVQERYLAGKIELEALEKYPPGSLGHSYASYIKDLGLELEFYRSLKVDDDTSYIFMRRRQTHDIWHIITGFKTDLASELGLKAFEIAQMRNTLSVVILVGGIIRTLFKAPEKLNDTFKFIVIGYLMGAEAKPFLAQKWEENWHKPLAEWREELGIVIPREIQAEASMSNLGQGAIENLYQNFPLKVR